MLLAVVVGAPIDMDRNCIRILALYSLLALLYAFGVPLWEAPDEPSHYLSVRRISDGRSFRLPRPPASGGLWSESYLYSLYERAQPPLYRLLAAPYAKAVFAQFLPLGDPPGFPAVRPDFRREGNLFVHARLSLLSIPANELRGHLLRLFSIILGAGAVFFIYRLARLLAPDSPPTALLAAGWAATLPQFVFVTAAIGNDSLAVLIASAALFYILCGSEKGSGHLAAGILLAAGLLAKANLLFFFPVAALSLLFSPAGRGERRRLLARSLALFLPAVILIALVLLLSPDTALPRARFLWLRASSLTPALLEPARFRLMAAELGRSFVARFGWMSISVGGWLYGCWAAAGGASVAGWIVGAARARRPALSGKALLLAACLFLLAGVIKNNLFVPQSQGRYLFPALPAISVLFAAGFLNLFPRPARRSASVVLVAALAFLNLAAFFGYLVPASYP